MDAEFEKFKLQLEHDLGRPVDHDEEHELKLFYYFGKGLKLKKQLESKPTSGPERIEPIAERALKDVEGRMERQRRSRIVSAVGDFLAGRKQRAKEHRSGRRFPGCECMF